MVFGLLVADQACVIHEPEKSFRLSAFLLTANSVSFRRRNCLAKEAGQKCYIANFVRIQRYHDLSDQLSMYDLGI